MIHVGELIQAPVRGRAIANLSVAEMVKNGQALGRGLALVASPAPSPVLMDEIEIDPDLFEAAGRIDAVLKSDRHSMEFPIFGLSVTHHVRVYERNGVTLTVKPGADGCATMHDKSVWIFCVSHLIAAANAGKKTGRKVRFHAQRFFEMLGRKVGSTDYKELTAALNRLAGTRIETNIKIGGKTIAENSGLIDGYATVRDDAGRLLCIEVTLPDWLIAAVRSNEVLTLSPAYFGLRRAIHRKLYEIARKHCGGQAAWSISVSALHQKIGSHDEVKKTRAVLRELVKNGDFPGYTLAISAGDIATFSKK